MRYILLFFIIFYSITYAGPFTLSKKEIKEIDKSYDKKRTKLRFKLVNNFLDEAKNFNEDEKIIKVNTTLNRVLPMNDNVKFNETDYWSTPKEFLINGYGDCEDYAISKYFTLLQLNVDNKKLYLAIVQVKGKVTKHMVLMYFKTKKSIPIILDNLTWKALPLDKRKDLKVQVIFNEYNTYRIKKYKIHKKVKLNWGKFNKWDDILDRVYIKKE